MTDISGNLRGKFVVANLGSAGDRDYGLSEELLRTISLVEIDAGEQSLTTPEKYHEYHAVRAVIAGAAGRRTFTFRKYDKCSSLNQPKKNLISEYALEPYFEPIRTMEVETQTFPAIVNGLGLRRIDFLKTDLEGEDFAVIKNCVESLSPILAIQTELRFEPFYEGEPFFHEVASYLHAKGYDLIGLQPEFWKKKTPRWTEHRDGRIVFSDCLFFLRPEILPTFEPTERSLARIKQVIIATMTGHKGYGEYLLEIYRKDLAPRWVEELGVMLAPERANLWTLMSGSVRALARTPLGRAIASKSRPFVKKKGGFDFSHVAR